MVESGVSQGSVLEPILFLIYVDDAARDLDCEVAMFADDMKIWIVIRGPADEDRLQMNLNRAIPSFVCLLRHVFSESIYPSLRLHQVASPSARNTVPLAPTVDVASKKKRRSKWQNPYPGTLSANFATAHATMLVERSPPFGWPSFSA
nr:unnamed protein product [Spirometra erinaceieuropaei]